MLRRTPILPIVCLTALLAVGHAFAAEYVWTGAKGNNQWATAGNWNVDGEVATSFPNATTAIVRFTTNANVSVSGGTYSVSTVSVECVGYTVTIGTELKVGNPNTSTGVLHVVSGATLTFSAALGGHNNSQTILKTGGGLLTSGDVWLGYRVPYPACFVVAEGEFRNNFRTMCPKVVVKSGATVSGAGDNGGANKPYTLVVLEEGSKYSRTSTVKGIIGTGTLTGGTPAENLVDGPWRFDGLIKSQFRPGWIYTTNYKTNEIFVAGLTNTLAGSTIDSGARFDRVRYAPDVGGKFWVGAWDCRSWPANCPIVSEDTSSIGVTLYFTGALKYMDYTSNARFKGKGTLHLPSSTYKAPYCFQEATGFISPNVNSTIFLGDKNASTTSTNLLWNVGTDCTRSTVYYYAPGATQYGALIGSNGTAWVEYPTTFMNFNLRNGRLAPRVNSGLGGVKIYDGVASLHTLEGGANYGNRPVNLYGGVIAGPFGTDTNLAKIVETTLPRPIAPVTKTQPEQYDYYISSTHICLPSGNGEYHVKPYSASISPSCDNLCAGTLFVYGALRYFTAVNGSRIAMCPSGTAEFKPSTVATAVSANGGEFISGLSANGANRNYAIHGLTGSGPATRYGAGYCRIVNRPTGFSGTLRILDGRFGLQENVADTSLTGTGPLELGTAKIERASATRLLLNAATVTGGALIVPGANRAKFTSLAFEKGGALFLDKTSADYAFVTQPTGVPIFDYASGTITKNATFCTGNHLVLAGGERSDSQLFTAHGILAVQSDTTFSGILAGSSGVGIVGPADGVKRVVTLSGTSLVKGGTYVSGVEVRPENEAAFGKGEVVVGAGEWMGGRLRFTKSVDFSANAFTAGGWGPVDEQGALLFEASTTLGSLAVSRPLRVRVEPNVAAIVMSPVASDEHIQVAGNGGTLILAGGKSGSGRLDIIKSSVRLTGAQPALGTGQIWLDDGTIEFANTEPLVVSNIIYGVGRIRCSGSDVTFASPGLDFDGRVEVPGSARVTFSTQAQLGDNLQIVFSRATDRGAVVDLGGVYRTVDRVIGYGKVTNTTYVQKHPTVRGGFQIIFR